MGKTFTLSQQPSIQYGAFRNYLQNPKFDFWQRGLSHNWTGGGTATFADRWWYQSSANFTIQANNGGVGEDYNGTWTQYRCMMTQNAGSSYQPALFQKIEDVRTLQNSACTLSGGIYSTITQDITPQLSQLFGSGGSTRVDTNGSVIACTANTWTWFERTFTLPSISGKTIGANSFLQLALYAAANTTFTWWVSNVQLERGPVRTPFELRPYEVELMLCQRYYESNYPINTTPPGTAYTNGIYGNLAYAMAPAAWHPLCCPYKVTKRTSSPLKWAIADDGTWNAGTYNGSSVTPIYLHVTDNAIRAMYNGHASYTIPANQWFDINWAVDAEIQ